MSGDDRPTPRHDPRLVAWMAALLIHDKHTRLIESGADRDPRIPLASVFVDLTVTHYLDPGQPGRSALHALVHGHEGHADDEPRIPKPARAWLLLGGPGAGKSTATAMAAQLLRAPWHSVLPETFPSDLRERARAVVDGLGALSVEVRAPADASTLPLRVNLPAFARWLTESLSDGAVTALYDHLAATMGTDLRAVGIDTECSGAEMRAMVHAAERVTWLFDGLDEVPAGNERTLISRTIHAVLAERDTHLRAVVTTRPQGYGGEFDDLPPWKLDPLEVETAIEFCKRLVRAARLPHDEQEIEATVRREFARPEVAALASTPLHAAIVASFIARQDELPQARVQLFERYFDVLFDREIRKLHAAEIRPEHRSVLLTIHARVGLALHVRSQSQPDAKLTTRELRALLVAFFREEGLDEERAHERAAKLLRFASERLVLILRVAEGGYAFGVRPLQEFFAARALWTPNCITLQQRLLAIATSPHWANVITLLASFAAVATPDMRPATAALINVCRALNEGEGGPTAARSLFGSRLALALLREINAYALPRIIDPLWQEALRIADTPVQRSALMWARRIRYGASPHDAEPCPAWDDNQEVHVRLGLLAFSGTGTSCARQLGDILARAELLLQGERGERWAGWHLILPGLRTDHVESLRLARKHLPTDRDEARGVVHLLLESAMAARIPDVVSVLVDAHAEWFAPGWLVASRWGEWRDDTSWPAALRIAALLAQTGSDRFNFFLLSTTSWSLGITVVPLPTQSTDIWEQIGALANNPESSLSIWSRVASFHASPAAESLADLLEHIDRDSLDELRRVDNRLAWPLAACLRHVDDVDDLAPLVARLRAGELGEREDWLAAEARWRLRTDAFELQSWSRWLAEPGPWAPHEDAPPLVSFILTTETTDTIPPPSVIQEAILGVLTAPEKVTKRALAATRSPLATTFWPTGLPLHVVSSFRDAPPAAFIGPINGLVPDLDDIGAEAGEWLNLLDERGRRGWITTHRFGLLEPRPWSARNIQHIARHLTTHPDRWGLAQALIALIALEPNTPLDDLHLDEPPGDATLRGIAWWTILVLLTSPHRDLETAMHRLHGIDEGTSYDFRPLLARILARRANNPERTESLLLAALDNTNSDDFLTREDILGALLAHLRRTARPAFTDARAWEIDYHFDPPHIAMQPAPPSPVQILSIDALSNVRLFRETPSVDAPFPTPSPNRGQWIVLLGENGVGKTTLLRALALTLTAPEVASKQLHSRLPLIRNGGPALLAFTLAPNTCFRAELQRVDGTTTETVVATGDPPAERPWVVGYGVRRGGALGEEGRIVDWAAEGNLHTLFERQPALVVAQDWLLKLDRQVQRQRVQAGTDAASTPATDLWNAVVTALTSALDVKDIIAGDDDDVYVVHTDFGRVPLESLSDGYLGTAGWIIDLIARWVRQREADGYLPSGDILGQMTGLVLIDEIDLHLHPRWQMRILGDVRRIFPRLSFVVTTHNPLTLQGARPGEVFIMRRGDGDRIEFSQRDIQPGHDIDRVLLEQFGIEHTFDRETREWLRDHRRLMVAGTPLTDPRRIDLEHKLASRLGTLGQAVVHERAGAPLTDIQRANLERLLRRRGTNARSES